MDTLVAPSPCAVVSINCCKRKSRETARSKFHLVHRVLTLFVGEVGNLYCPGNCHHVKNCASGIVFDHFFILCIVSCLTLHFCISTKTRVYQIALYCLFHVMMSDTVCLTWENVNITNCHELILRHFGRSYSSRLVCTFLTNTTP